MLWIGQSIIDEQLCVFEKVPYMSKVYLNSILTKFENDFGDGTIISHL